MRLVAHADNEIINFNFSGTFAVSKIQIFLRTQNINLNQDQKEIVSLEQGKHIAYGDHTSNNIQI